MKGGWFFLEWRVFLELEVENIFFFFFTILFYVFDSTPDPLFALFRNNTVHGRRIDYFLYVFFVIKNVLLFHDGKIRYRSVYCYNYTYVIKVIK